MKTAVYKKWGIWLFALSLLAVQIFLRSAHADIGESWQKVYAKNGECKIAFPQTPQLVEQSLNISNSQDKLYYDVYLAPLEDQSVCLLLIATYPTPVASGQEIMGLEGLIRGIVGHHPENQLTYAEVGDLGGRPLVNFLVQNGSSYFRRQALMVGTKLFLIAMEGKKGSLHEPTFNKFSGSFELLHKSP